MQNIPANCKPWLGISSPPFLFFFTEGNEGNEEMRTGPVFSAVGAARRPYRWRQSTKARAKLRQVVGTLRRRRPLQEFDGESNVPAIANVTPTPSSRALLRSLRFLL